MDFYKTLGRLLRLVLVVVLLMAAGSSIQDSMGDIKIVEIAKQIEGEFFLQIEDIGVTLALNDSTFILKVEA